MKKEKVLQFKKNEKVKPSLGRAYAIFNEGKFLYNKNQDDLALEKFIQAEKAGYGDGEMFTFMAWLYGRENKYPDLVIKYADKAIEYDDENGYIYYLKGYSLADNHKIDEALENFLKAEELNYNICPLFTRMSYLYQLKEDFLKSLAYASKAVKSFPDESFAYFRKGGTYYYFEHYDEALKYFLEAEKRGKVDSEICFKISYCYSMLENQQKALVYANKAIMLDRNDPFGYYRKGFIYYQLEDYEKALKAYLTAEKLCEDTVGFYDMYARLSWIFQNVKNDIDSALKYADKAIELNSKDSFSQYRKACVLAYGLKKYSESIKYYKKAYQLDKTFIELFFDMANAYMNIKKYKLGLKYLEEGLELFPDNSELLGLKASILYLSNKAEESMAILKALLKKSPDDNWLIQAYAMALCEMKKYEEAIKYLEPIENKLAEINPAALFALGYAYFKLKNFDKSLDVILLYAQHEDMSFLDAKDKKVIKKTIEKLEKIFLQDKRILEIKRIFSSFIN